MKNQPPFFCCDCFRHVKLFEFVDAHLTSLFISDFFICEQCLESRRLDFARDLSCMPIGITSPFPNTKWSDAGQIILELPEADENVVVVEVRVLVPVKSKNNLRKCGEVRVKPTDWEFWVAAPSVDLKFPGVLTSVHDFALSTVRTHWVPVQFPKYNVRDTVYFRFNP